MSEPLVIVPMKRGEHVWRKCEGGVIQEALEESGVMFRAGGQEVFVPASAMTEAMRLIAGGRRK